jgi:hypothetical protein
VSRCFAPGSYEISYDPGKFPGVIFIKDENADVELALQRPGTGALIVVAHPKKRRRGEDSENTKKQHIWIKHSRSKDTPKSTVHDYDQIVIRIPMITLCSINKDPENKQF